MFLFANKRIPTFQIRIMRPTFFQNSDKQRKKR